MLKKLPDWSEAETKAKLAEAEAISQRLQKNNKFATVAWTARQIEHLSKEVADFILDLREAVRDLEAKFEMLEDAQLKYQGVFTKDQQYNHNDLCTHRGGLWICKAATRSAPGTSSDWQLTHKTIAARGQKA